MKNDIFKVPTNYFEELPLLIQDRILKESPLNAYKQENIFKVPAQYFEDLPAHIQMRVAKLAGNYFEVPAQYFEDLPAHIQQKIQAVLPAVGKIQEAMQVPDAYFENLQHQILRKVNQSKQVKNSYQVVYKWSLASVLVLIMFGGFWYVGRQGIDKTLIVENKPEKIEKQAITTPNPQEDKLPPIKEEKKENVFVAEVIQPIQPTLPTKTEDALAQYLSKADEHTEEAIAALISQEDMADDGSNTAHEDWQETHEEILHEITEEEINNLPKILKKETNPKGEK